MPEGLTGGPLRLRELFSDPFVIECPPYQRPFSWTEEEALRLLDDVTRTLNETDGMRGYMLGAILLVDTEAEFSQSSEPTLGRLPRRFEVVDGQQRIITLAILLAILRDLEAQAGDSPDPTLVTACAVQDNGGRWTYRMCPRGADAAAMARFVQPHGATLVDIDDSELSASAGRILAVRLHLLHALTEMAPEDRRRLRDYLLERCSVLAAITSDVDRAHQMFSALNGRGKPLTRTDILKAEMLGNANSPDARRLVGIWERAAATIGDGFERFFTHLRVVEGSTSGQIIEALRTVAKKRGGAQQFIETVVGPYAEVYAAILRADHQGAPQSAEINRLLTYLDWLPSTEWVPPAMLWWRLHGDDSAALLWFLRALERLAYGTRILGHGNDKRSQRFAAVGAAIQRRETMTPGHETLILARDDRRSIEYNLRDLHGRNQQICKLVLMRLADARSGRITRAVNGELTVEHILPAKPAADGSWSRWFPDPNRRQRLCSSIGNLALLPSALNDRARNHEFQRKLSVYREADNEMVAELLGDVVDRSEWHAADIERREAELLETIEQLWNFKDVQIVPDPAAAGSDPEAPRTRRRRG